LGSNSAHEYSAFRFDGLFVSTTIFYVALSELGEKYHICDIVTSWRARYRGQISEAQVLPIKEVSGIDC